MSVLSAAVLLFLVMDPFGNIPPFMVELRDVPRGRREAVILREAAIALAALVAFLFGGRYVLELLRIEEPSLSIAGGVILFLIAIRMIFPGRGRSGVVVVADSPDGPRRGGTEEPLIVPLAIPYVAGPSAAATILLLTTREPARTLEWLLALACAWVATTAVLLLSAPLSALLGDRALGAVARLMGMILTVVAVQMMVSGLRVVLAAHA